MKKLLLLLALVVVVSYGDTTTTIVTDLHTSKDSLAHIEEHKKPKEKENKLLSAVIMMLFVGLSMGVVGNMNPR